MTGLLLEVSLPKCSCPVAVLPAWHAALWSQGRICNKLESFRAASLASLSFEIKVFETLCKSCLLTQGMPGHPLGGIAF